MDILSVFKFLGGVALFLYGMNIMGGSLEKQAGGRFRQVLEKITSNPVKGVILGTLVTGIIQSSSATTVMVVGFVNSGIMTLENSVGVIMGANIGTAVTAWILSLTGLEGESLIVQLCKPSNFSPILAVIGIVMIMGSKSEKKRDIATVLLGFSVLMYGMEVMSDMVEPLSDNAAFTSILTMFQNPIFGVLAGTVVTGIIQSSSASVGILQAMSATGSITVASAVPIVMGQNIGTCVTALLSSVGTNANARRAAMIHLYFNIIGVVVFLSLFYLVDGLVGFSFMGDAATPVSIAVIHTVFKIVNTCFFLPFNKLLVRLAKLSVKDDPGEEKFVMLDERFLNTPAVAIDCCRELTHNMAILSRNSLFSAMDLTHHFDEHKAQAILADEDTVDQYEDKLGTYMVKLSSRTLGDSEGLELGRLLHCIGDLERISDHAVNIAETAREIEQKNLSFSGPAREEVDVMFAAVREIATIAVDAFIHNDCALAKHVEPLEEVVDLLNRELKARHIARLQRGECTTMLGFVFSDLITNFERVADHCSNIALCILQSQKSDRGTHQYIIDLKNSDDPDFRRYYREYAEKYHLDQA